MSWLKTLQRLWRGPPPLPKPVVSEQYMLDHPEAFEVLEYFLSDHIGTCPHCANDARYRIKKVKRAWWNGELDCGWYLHPIIICDACKLPFYPDKLVEVDQSLFDESRERHDHAVV